MDVLPLALKLAGQPCLVVGGGEVARRKIERLLAAKAEVAVVALTASPAVRELCQGGRTTLAERAFGAADVAGRLLVIAATNDPAVNQEVYDACARYRVLVNCVDDGERSTALFPAIVERGPVTVAISTGGASPTLARHLRERIEALLPASVGRLAAYLASRRRIKSALPDSRARQRFWDRAIDSKLETLVGRGDIEQADAALEAALTMPQGAASPGGDGLVSLVGAGPGDADLLTVKALRCLQRADVVYYDNLVGAEVLERCRRDAKLVYVGRHAAKDAGDASARQASINHRLQADASQGLRVVRLKGGDPLLFGRGGEEMSTLSDCGIPFEVVPGVTAALGCAAVAGIPLTHRDCSQSVRFVTGHLKNDEFNLDWPELAKPDQTLVVYMGLGPLARLCERLVAHGADPDTPAAAISRGTLPDQRVVRGRIRDLAAKAQAENLETPATIIIGRVAGLRLGG